MGDGAILSRNEVKFYFTRAAVGAGTTFGIGEKLANCALWIANQGSDPCTIIAPALKALENGTSSSQFTYNGRCLLSDEPGFLSAICVAPTVADLFDLANETSTLPLHLELKRVDQPILILASAIGSSKQNGFVELSWKNPNTHESISFEFSNSDELRSSQAMLKLQTMSKINPSDISICFHGYRSNPTNNNANFNLMPNTSNCVPVSGADWHCIYSFFEKCLVPSNEKSRLTGAGAGLTDND